MIELNQVPYGSGTIPGDTFPTVTQGRGLFPPVIANVLMVVTSPRRGRGRECGVFTPVPNSFKLEATQRPLRPACGLPTQLQRRRGDGGSVERLSEDGLVFSSSSHGSRELYWKVQWGDDWRCSRLGTRGFNEPLILRAGIRDGCLEPCLFL